MIREWFNTFIEIFTSALLGVGIGLLFALGVLILTSIFE